MTNIALNMSEISEHDTSNASNDVAFIGAKDAIAKGLIDECPEGERCPFCGVVLLPHGIVLGKTFVWTGFDKCGCEGAVAHRRKQDAEEASRAAEKAEERRVKSLLERGIPRRFLNAQVRDTRISEFLGQFGSKPSCGLYIFGLVGRGKTTAASAVAIEFFKAGYKPVMTGAAEMLEALKDTFGSQASTADVFARFKACDLLVIDDIGKESARNWSISTMFSIVNARYEAMLPTIYTSQYSLSELQKNLSRNGEADTAGAICSRIYETSRLIHLTGPDYRRQNSAQ